MRESMTGAAFHIIIKWVLVRNSTCIRDSLNFLYTIMCIILYTYTDYKRLNRKLVLILPLS